MMVQRLWIVQLHLTWRVLLSVNKLVDVKMLLQQSTTASAYNTNLQFIFLKHLQ